MRKQAYISAAVFALLQAAGMWAVGAVSPAAEPTVSVLADSTAGSAGSGGISDPTDHGSNSSVLTDENDPVLQEDRRPHASKLVEEAADGR